MQIIVVHVTRYNIIHGIFMYHREKRRSLTGDNFWQTCLESGNKDQLWGNKSVIQFYIIISVLRGIIYNNKLHGSFIMIDFASNQN